MRTTKGGRAALGGALLAVGLVTTAAPALAGTRYESKVTLANSFPAFHGKVKSDNGICVENRRVRLFSEMPGKDTLLGKTRTNANGRWKILQDPTSGVFYARVKKGGSASLGIRCEADTSKPVVID